VAVVVTGRAASRVLSVPLDRGRSRPHRLFAARGRLTDVSWSPDGRRLLVAWRDADRWIMLDPDGAERVVFSRIADQFDPGATGKTSFPRIAGWCCAAD
jgi:dipeptidyl aminopeptidase/acylaminoacyl peptidase